jgi:hypothetical protein
MGASYGEIARSSQIHGSVATFSEAAGDYQLQCSKLLILSCLPSCRLENPFARKGNVDIRNRS